MASAVSRQYVKNEVNLKQYTSTAFRIVLISFSIIFILFLSFTDFIYEWTAIPKVVLYAISIFALLDNLMEVVLAIWRMEDKPFKYGAFRVMRTLIELLITLALVIGLEYNWEGRFYGLYLAGALSGLFAFGYLLSNKYFSQGYVSSYKNHF